MTRKLRIHSIILQPVLVWDDGEELTEGPHLGQMAVPVSRLADIAATMPAEVAALQAKLENEASQDGFKVHPVEQDGRTEYVVSWGGQWLEGSYSTADDALVAGRAQVAGTN